MYFAFLLLVGLYSESSGTTEVLPISTLALTIPTVGTSRAVKDPWPRVLVARTPGQSIYIQTFDPNTGDTLTLSKLIQAPSTPSLAGSIDGRICYSLARRPWFACVQNGTAWKLVHYEDPQKPTAEKTHVKLDLSPDGERLMFMTYTGELFLTFLNKGGDTVKVSNIDFKTSSTAIEDFAVDWITGVLAVVRWEHIRENPRILEVVSAFESVDFGNPQFDRLFQQRIPEVDSKGLRLMFDVDRKVLYVLNGNGSIGHASYQNFEEMTMKYLQHSNGSHVQIPVQQVPKQPLAVFAFQGCIYYLNSQGDQMLRLNTETLKTEPAPVAIPRTEFLNYTQVALDTSSLSHLVTANVTCTKCSHRCFPKYRHEVACGCPIGSLGGMGNRCESNEPLVAIWTNGSSSPTLLNMLTGNEQLVDLPKILNDSSIDPRHFVKLSSPSSSQRRFCVLSRTNMNASIISCHRFESPQDFVWVPVALPNEYDERVRVSSLTEEGDSKKWTLTWIDPDSENFLFKTSAEPGEVLTLITDVFHGKQREFHIDGSTFIYTTLSVNGGYGQLVTDEKGYSVRAVDVTSLRIHHNIITYFDADSEGRLFLCYIRAGTENTSRVELGANRYMHYKTPFSPTSKFGDICWIQDYDQVKCLLNNFQNPVVHKMRSSRILEMSEQAWTVKPETHDCFTGVHNCSHICRPHIDKTKDIELSDPVRFEPGYTCLCPREFPILLQGRQCTFRLTIGVTMHVAGHGIVASVWKIAEHKIQKLSKSPLDPNVEYNFDVAANLLCWLETSGVVCGNSFVIPGSRGAKFLIRNQMRFFSNEVYWMAKNSSGGNVHKYCVYVGSANRNVSLGLGCLNLIDFQLSKNQVAVDSHRKLIFWAKETSTAIPVVHMGRISSNGTITSESSYTLKQYQDDHLGVSSLNSDSFSSRLYVGTSKPALFQLQYSVSNGVLHFHSKEIPLSAAQFVTVNGIPLFYQQITAQIIHVVQETRLFFPLLNVSKLLNEDPANFELFDIQSAYTAKELNATSPCFDASCEYFCQLVQTPHGNISQCLCPSDPTAEVSDFQYCSEVQKEPQTLFSLLAVTLSVGLFIFVASTAVLVVCLHRKRREKAHLKRVVQAFKEGDARRAEASKDEAEKAQYLPFKAIIAAEDLIVNEVEILGEGNFGTVYEGEFSGETVAVKTTKSDLDPKAIEDFLKELKIMEFVGDHSNIVKFYGAEISKIEDGRVLVVLELCPHGNLLDYLREYSTSLEKKRNDSVYSNVSMSEIPLGLEESGYKSHSFLQGKKMNVRPISSKKVKVETVELFAYKTFTDSAADSNNPYSTFDFKSLPQANCADTRSNKPYSAFQFNSLLQKNPTEQELQKEDSGPKALPKLCFHWARQIAAGLEYLESKHVVHGDMAARNVLVFDNDVVKVSDFGFSRKVYQYQIYRKKEACELPMRWAAPETIARHEFSSKADVWSFGVTMWEIFTFGDVPFCYCEVDDEFFDRLIDGKVRLRCPKLLPQESFQQLLLPCWQLDPKQRPSFTLMKTTLDGVFESCSDC